MLSIDVDMNIRLFNKHINQKRHLQQFWNICWCPQEHSNNAGDRSHISLYGHAGMCAPCGWVFGLEFSWNRMHIQQISLPPFSFLPKYFYSFPIDKNQVSNAILSNSQNLKKIVKIVHLEISKKMNLIRLLNHNAILLKVKYFISFN